MHTLAKSLVVALLLQLIVPMAANAAPDPGAEAVFTKLLTATITADHEAFIAECDATMKAALSKDMLAGVSKLVVPRFKQGYETEYLGELNQHGFAVHLWRVRCKDGGDDFLATLSIKDGKVGGFYLQ